MAVPPFSGINESFGWVPRSNVSRFVFVLASVLLYQVSQPGSQLPWLVFVSLVPLALGLHGASLRVAASLGFFYGFVCWLGSTPGLVFASATYLQLTYPAALAYVVLFCTYHAVPYAIFGIVQGALRWTKYPLGAIYPAASLAVAVILFPSPMPVSLEHSLYAFPLVLQVLDVGGRPLLLFLLAWGNWLMADVILKASAHQDMKVASYILAVLVSGVCTYGVVRLAQLDYVDAIDGPRNKIRIGVVQPEFPLPGRVDDGSTSTEHFLNRLTRLSEQLSSGEKRMDLIVWPEIPYRIDCSSRTENRSTLAALAERLATPLLINCVQGELEKGESNTALFLKSRSEDSAYIKRRLFPFVEYLPGEKKWPGLRRIMSGVSHYVPGERAVVFELNNALRVFSPVCYEALFSSLVKEFVYKGGNVMVSQANDAWFGKSNIADFLIATSTLRAVTYRIPVVRASNSGNSIGVKANGLRVKDPVAGMRPEHTIVFDLIVPSQRSPYNYIGDLVLIMLALCVGLVICWKVFFQKVRQ